MRVRFHDLLIGGAPCPRDSQATEIVAAYLSERWVYDPETWKGGTPSNNGFVHRGVAYWGMATIDASCSAPAMATWSA
jgi:hypothetical protein